MDRLHRAVAMGYRNPDAYRTEEALDPLRDRPDFRLMMMDLAMPVEPFAAGIERKRPFREAVRKPVLAPEWGR